MISIDFQKNSEKSGKLAHLRPKKHHFFFFFFFGTQTSTENVTTFAKIQKYKALLHTP
jgi:hypothetical protein